jgi:hypothetical protein
MEDDQDHYGPSRGFLAGIAAAAICLLLAGYAIREHIITKNLSEQNSQLTASLNADRNQLNQLSATVDALSAKQQAQAKPAAPVAKPSPVRRTAIHHRRAHSRYADSRYTRMQRQLDAQGKEIADTRNDLANARTEFSGGIAKNHTELVVLERKGERNYAEFDIFKSKQFQDHAHVGIRLRKANVKHQYADLELFVDDRKLTQKHVNLYQPVMFYTPDSPQPVELVINDITKNHIHGYVSSSKYSKSELAAMPNAQSSANGDVQPPQRKQLTIPQQ